MTAGLEADIAAVARIEAVPTILEVSAPRRHGVCRSRSGNRGHMLNRRNERIAEPARHGANRASSRR
jgi:hypothetical protein